MLTGTYGWLRICMMGGLGAGLGLSPASCACAADLVPARIVSQVAQPVPVVPAPATTATSLEPQPDPYEAAMEAFDTVRAEEPVSTVPQVPPTLAPATKNRMFGWRGEDHYRAGCPQQQRHLTMTSDNNRYTGYKVGGGSAVIGTGPYIDEGTWGLDYMGFFPKKIALNWNRGLREQGGTGAYKTDGPKLHE